MRILILLLALTSSNFKSLSQTDLAAIEQTITQLFDAMRQNDSTLAEDVFLPGSELNSIFVNRDGEVIKKGSPATKFVTAIGQPRTQVWNEIIWSYDIKVDHPMAQAWTEYTFYVDDQMSHCGVNVFEMIHVDDGWKISGVTDTRRKVNCKTKEAQDINNIMDAWHHAAAVADEEVFFGSMMADAIYIGTDPSERWTTAEMIHWAKPYFERDTTWDFDVIERNVEVESGATIAWFDELLDTWMGPCRGSGVMIKTTDGWKLKHYHLSVAVANDTMDSYLNLIGKTQK